MSYNYSSFFGYLKYINSLLVNNFVLNKFIKHYINNLYIFIED